VTGRVWIRARGSPKATGCLGLLLLLDDNALHDTTSRHNRGTAARAAAALDQAAVPSPSTRAVGPPAAGSAGAWLWLPAKQRVLQRTCRRCAREGARTRARALTQAPQLLGRHTSAPAGLCSCGHHTKRTRGRGGDRGSGVSPCMLRARPASPGQPHGSCSLDFAPSLKGCLQAGWLWGGQHPAPVAGAQQPAASRGCMEEAAVPPAPPALALSLQPRAVPWARGHGHTEPGPPACIPPLGAGMVQPPWERAGGEGAALSSPQPVPGRAPAPGPASLLEQPHAVRRKGLGARESSPQRPASPRRLRPITSSSAKTGPGTPGPEHPAGAAPLPGSMAAGCEHDALLSRAAGDPAAPAAPAKPVNAPSSGTGHPAAPGHRREPPRLEEGPLCWRRAPEPGGRG